MTHSPWFYVYPTFCMIVIGMLTLLPIWIAIARRIEQYRYDLDYQERCRLIDEANSQDPDGFQVGYPAYRTKAPWEWYRDIK